MPSEPVSQLAVLDRIEGGLAVLLAESPAAEFTVPVSALPEGATEQDVVRLGWVEDELIVLDIDRHTTDARRASLDARLQGLRDTRSGRRFRRS